MVQRGVTYRLVTDQAGSVRLFVNALTGAIAERIDYDEFGNALLDSAPGFQPFGFAGGLYDRDTGRVRFGVRDYDGGTGRWTAKDPLLFGDGLTRWGTSCPSSFPVREAQPSVVSGSTTLSACT
jgi:RHS repeat-associated protein